MKLIKKITAGFLLAFLLIPNLVIAAQEPTPCEMNPELPECTEIPPLDPCVMNPALPECMPPIPEIPCEMTETCEPTPEGPTLTVIKELIQDNGGTAEITDFNYYIGESQVYSGEANEFPAGTYNVTESYPSESEEAKYSTTFSGDCDAEGQVTMDGESSKTCTITNNDIPANLNVVVDVINDNGGSSSPSSFPIHVTATDPSDANFNGVSGKGYPITEAKKHFKKTFYSYRQKCRPQFLKQRRGTGTNSCLLVRQWKLVYRLFTFSNRGEKKKIHDFQNSRCIYNQ